MKADRQAWKDGLRHPHTRPRLRPGSAALGLRSMMIGGFTNAVLLQSGSGHALRGNETSDVRLANPRNTILGDAEATGTILDDVELPPQGTAQPVPTLGTFALALLGGLMTAGGDGSCAAGMPD